MREWIRYAALPLALNAFAEPISLARAAAQAPHVPGEVLVGLKDGPTRAASHTEDFRGCHVRNCFEPVSQNCGPAILHLQDANRTTQELLDALETDPDVAFVEPNYIRQSFFSAAPDDPRYDQQWGLQNIGQSIAGRTGAADADIGWSEARRLRAVSGEEVVIAVIDSGIDGAHADLRDQLWRNPGEIPGNGIDDDGNGYIDDIVGWDFAFNDNDPADLDSSGASIDHGTHVAGIAAAAADNGLGIAGVAQARLMVLKADDGEGLANSAIIEATNYVNDMVQRGVNVVVVNASYGGPSFSQAEKNAIDSLAASGVVFCAAAGNESADNDSTASYPANYTSANLISVAATDNRDALANFSNFGASTVDLAAPGALIYSTVVASYDASVRLNDAAYPAETFLYSGLTEELTRPYYDCGLGGSLADFPPEVFGNIALIERGTFTFSEKIRNAMEMGAAAAVIYNQASAPADELINGTLGAPDDWIAAAAVSRNTGLALLPAADNGTLLTLSVSMNDASAYAYQSGTSMAAPMVSGAIAMLARHFPEDGVAERIQRLYDALDPLPQLSGRTLTSGRLALAPAMDRDGDGLPDWFEGALGPLDSIDTGSDSDADGTSDLWEFRGGLDPRDPSSRFSVSSVAEASPGDGLTLRWPSAVGRYYRIEAADSLESTFSSFEANIEGTPPFNSWTIPRGLKQQQFFRVRLVWPEE